MRFDTDKITPVRTFGQEAEGAFANRNPLATPKKVAFLVMNLRVGPRYRTAWPRSRHSWPCPLTAEQAIQQKYGVLSELLDERGRRGWAAVEAGQLGRGGVAAVARATGLSRTTLYQGLEALAQPSGPGFLRQERTRAPGGGRKRLVAKNPQVLESLERLVDPVTRGDPASPLRWTLKSTRQLAEVLTRQGHPVGRQKVSALLAELAWQAADQS